MDYKITEDILKFIYQFAFDNKILVIIIWMIIMFFLLRKLSKKDNDWYLKNFFKKKLKFN